MVCANAPLPPYGRLISSCYCTLPQGMFGKQIISMVTHADKCMCTWSDVNNKISLIVKVMRHTFACGTLTVLTCTCTLDNSQYSTIQVILVILFLSYAMTYEHTRVKKPWDAFYGSKHNTVFIRIVAVATINFVPSSVRLLFDVQLLFE